MGNQVRTRGVWVAWAMMLAACGSGESPSEAPKTAEEEVAEAAEEPSVKEVVSAATTSSPAPGTAPSSVIGETRAEKISRLVQGEIPAQTGFEVTVLSLTLEAEPTRRGRPGGVRLKMAGVVYNRTGRTLSSGVFGGALLLHFGDKTTKLRLSPDGFKELVSAETPWREGQSRLFRIETNPFPELMLEYEPEGVEARIFAAFEDPVDFEVVAPVWRTSINWLAARVAPVKGQAQVFEAATLKAGPKGAANGKLENGEVVDLLYQSGSYFRVRAAAGEGWVEGKALVVKNLAAIYDGALAHGGDETVSDDVLSITVHEMKVLDSVPDEIKLADGERILQVDAELVNKGEKDLRCSDLFVDFGPGQQRAPAKESATLPEALVCDKDKLPAGATLRGRVAWRRGRHEIPMAVGMVSPTGKVLTVDVYDVEEAAPYRK